MMGRDLRRESDGGKSLWRRTTMRKSRGMQERLRLHVISVGVELLLLLLLLIEC